MEQSPALLIRVCLYAGLAIIWAQAVRAQPTSAEAAANPGAWRTWAISSSNSISVPAPPDPTTAAAEIRDLSTRPAGDTATLDRVAYWNAGWPGYRWQEVTLAKLSKDNRPNFWRTFALVSVAINDATVATWNAKTQYGRARPSTVDPSIKPLVPVPNSPSYPAEHAAVAAAVADVLAYIFPNDASELARLADEAGQSRVVAGVQYPSDVQAGIALGHDVATAVIAHAKADRSNVPWDGRIRTGPYLWAGTNPALPSMGSWVPWVLKSGDQFRPPPPPEPTSAQRAAELLELMSYPRTLVSRRLSWFWADFPELREWIAITNLKIFENRLDDDPPAASGAMAMLGVASFDAFVSCFEAKYLLPRPPAGPVRPERRGPVPGAEPSVLSRRPWMRGRRGSGRFEFAVSS